MTDNCKVCGTGLLHLVRGGIDFWFCPKCYPHVLERNEKYILPEQAWKMDYSKKAKVVNRSCLICPAWGKLCIGSTICPDTDDS